MKYFLLLLITFVSLNSFSQERHFFGKVVDKDKKTGIPFCVVKAKDRNEGVYTDENGRFSFTSNTDSVKAFIFYSLGYGRREVACAEFPNDSITVELQKEYTNLKEVVVVPDGKRRKILGKKKARHMSDCYQKYGEENAVFLRADHLNNGYLKELFVYITDEGIPDTKFRMHVYEKDPVTNMPGTELTDSNLIVHANRGNEWVKADLGNKRIPVGGGVYISVEWIAGHGNNVASMQSAKHTEVTGHNGQVMGLQRNYGVAYMYHRYPFHTEWISNWDANLNPALCPMIYGTYTYNRK